MSHIPNSVMPHAGPTNTDKSDTNQDSAGGGAMAGVKSRAGKIADSARSNPKTAIAAGAALVAGVAAAAAIPLLRGRNADTETAKKSGGKKKQTEAA